MESDRDPDLCDRSDLTAIGRAARNRVRDLGSRVFVAWRSRLTDRRLALFRRRDVHARRIRADAATTLADDGRIDCKQDDRSKKNRGESHQNRRNRLSYFTLLWWSKNTLSRWLAVANDLCVVVGSSGGPFSPSPPAEKATARQDQAGQASTHDGTGDCQESPHLAACPYSIPSSMRP